MKLEYEYTLEDLVDSSRRAMLRSKTVQDMRTRSIWATTLTAGVALVATWWYSSGASSSPKLTIPIAVAVVVSTIIYFGYSRYYDWLATYRTKRILREHLKKSKSRLCEMETRGDSLWVRQDAVEITYGWNDLEKVVDTGNDVELRFRNGSVIARNRAFGSDADRAEFIRVVSVHIA